MQVVSRARVCSSARALVLALGVIAAVASASGQVVVQLTDERTSVAGVGALDDAGSIVVTGVSANLDGNNPRHAFELVAFDPASGTPTVLTGSRFGTALLGSVSDDGNTIVFVSSSDPVGLNHDASPEVFLMNGDGSGIVQLTSDPAPNAASAGIAVVCGDGGRVYFTSNGDPLGENPDQREQLFVIERDGSGLDQLTSFSSGGLGFISVSDDGNRVVFGHDGDPLGTNPDLGGEVFALAGDGGGLRQLTTSPAGYSASLPAISGAGERVAYQSDADPLGTNTEHQDEIFAIDWDGAGLTQITVTRAVLGITGDPAAQFPSITDDASWIYYHSNYSTLLTNFDGNFEIYRSRGDGSDRALLTSTALSAGSFLPVVSGSGSRVAFYELDDDLALRAMNGDGSAEQDLLAMEVVLQSAPALTPDGTRAVFVRSESLLGGGQLYRVDDDGADAVPVTELSSGTPATPSITADGQTIVFGLDDEIWRVRADGSDLTQLTDGPDGTTRANPTVAADGSVIAYEQDDGTSRQVYRMDLDGGGVLALTAGGAGSSSRLPRVDGVGSWVTFTSDADFAGGNPDGSDEIHRVRTDASGLEQLTSSALDSGGADISSSGARIVFASPADLVGANPEGNAEIYLYDEATAALTQLTNSAEGRSIAPRISGDGTWVYFESDAPYFEDDPDRPADLFRVAADGSRLERVSALRRGAGISLGPVSLGGSAGLDVDDTGERAVFAGFGDFTERNPDLLSELWLIDRLRPSIIQVSPSAPTVVDWTPESGPLRYDIVRGDLKGLGPGGSGAVDLGAVVCIEDDSPETDTVGDEDAVEPLPGAGFFYLFRGSQGLDAGPGSYGGGSSGGERSASSGDCP